MPRRIIAAIAALTISIASIACSGGETPPETGAGTAPPAQAQAQPENAPQGPGPVRVTRPHQAPAPGPEPDRNPRGNTEDRGNAISTGSANHTGGRKGPGRPGSKPSPPRRRRTGPPQKRPKGRPARGPRRAWHPGDLIPEDPETNDEVLLQDIYALMDLDRFALDPGAPIPIPGLAEKKPSTTHDVNLFVENFFDDQAEPRRSKYPDSIFELAEVEGPPLPPPVPGVEVDRREGRTVPEENRSQNVHIQPIRGNRQQIPTLPKINRTLPPQGTGTRTSSTTHGSSLWKKRK